MAEQEKTMPEGWKTVSSDTVHENPWFRVSHDAFMTPTGKSGDFFVIHTHGTDRSVMIVAIEEGEILLARQYRYTVSEWTLEIPGGGVPKGVTVNEMAVMELREELGFEADHLEQVGEFHAWVGATAETRVVFLATGLKHVGQDLEDMEEGLHLVRIGIREAYAMCDDGRIRDASTLAALALVRKRLLGAFDTD
ncbi:MAG: NUDIX hydrolase [Candidatus Moraniibacteriota bacterium]